MTPDTQTHRGSAFLIGLMAGTAVGAGLALWLVPRAAAEARQRVTDSANAVRDRAIDRYRQVSTRVVDTVDDLASKGTDVRNELAEAVVRGARGVERLAKAAKADRG